MRERVLKIYFGSQRGPAARLHSIFNDKFGPKEVAESPLNVVVAVVMVGGRGNNRVSLLAKT